MLQGADFPAFRIARTYVQGGDAQISDNIGAGGIVAGHFARNRADRPYMKEGMPAWGSSRPMLMSAWPRIGPR